MTSINDSLTQIDNQSILSVRQGKPYYNNLKGLIYYQTPNPFIVNSSTGGNCTWYAWGRFWEAMASVDKTYQTSRPTLVSNSNACYFARDAKAAGYTVGLEPRPGAIICWGYYGAALGNPGHVAFVESVTYDAQGVAQSIYITHSGWSGGPLADKIIYRGKGTLGTGSWDVGWNNSYFNGFIYNPVVFKGTVLNTTSGAVANVPIETTSKVSSSITSEDESIISDSSQIEDFYPYMKVAANKLSSSDNYQFLTDEEYQPTWWQQLRKKKSTTVSGAISYWKNTLEKLRGNPDSCEVDKSVVTIGDSWLNNMSSAFKELLTTPKQVKSKSELYIGSNVIESPFIELTLDDVKLGTFSSTLDNYPNYLQSLRVVKQNGLINQYTFNLVHQVRAGDDSNLLDEVLSKVNFQKINIKYGDCNSGLYFQDTDAIITNVSMSRNYTAMNIIYTIEATSAGALVKTHTMNFQSVVDKPSNVIENLLWGNNETSKILLSAYPAMANKSLVESAGWLVHNDAVCDIDGAYGVDILSYITYLVGCMSNELSGNEVIRNSTYYITFSDGTIESNNKPYFSINEVTADFNPYNKTNDIYSITVGYNEDLIYDFSIESTDSWELLYKAATVSPEYSYSISSDGIKSKKYSPSLNSSSQILSERNKNWWTQMVKFPISATLTIKGLLRPIKLMDYIDITVLFFGQKHLTSGIYAITGQTDELSSSGYRTTLSLIRVSGN